MFFRYDSLTESRNMWIYYICKIRETTMWVISYESRICPDSWARNWVNIMVKNTFAISMINKSKFFFKKEKKLILFIFICSCLHYFHSNERLQSHMVDWPINDCVIRLPSDDGKWLSFNNYNRKERVFVVYADLE